MSDRDVGSPAPPVRAVFEALERAAVRWCLLRGETDLEAAAHDLDLLVAQEDVAALAAAVRPLGFVAVPAPARGSHRFFVSYLRPLDRWLILDVVTQLSYGPDYALRTRAAAGCLARRETAGSLRVPCADDAFWTLLLHRLLDRGSFRARDRERLQGLVRGAGTDGPLARFAAAMCPAGWDPAAIVEGVRRSEWDSLSGLGGQMLASWRRKHPAQFAARRVVASVRWRVAPRVAGLALPGLRIVLIAGNAATAKELAAPLSREFCLPVALLRPVESPRPRGGPAAAARRLSTSAGRCVVARLHHLRGRLVVLPIAAPAAEPAAAALHTAAPGFRAQAVFDVRRGRETQAPERYLGVRRIPVYRIDSARELTAGLWRAYCERRG